MINNQLNIIKIGGNVIDDDEALKQFLEDFAQFPGEKLLVHGGGKIASRLSDKLGIEPKFHEGRRITDAGSLDVAVMVYAGLTNKKITAILQGLGVNALGLSGCDGNLMKAVIRPKIPIDFGFVGDISPDGINIDFLQMLLSAGIVPVICAITHDGEGNLLNTNADTIATVLTQAISALYETSLYYCFEKPGVMMDINDNNSVINNLTHKNYKLLKESGIIDKGMLPKLDNAFSALRAGVGRVFICSSDDLSEIILNKKNKGTTIEF